MPSRRARAAASRRSPSPRTCSWCTRRAGRRGEHARRRGERDLAPARALTDQRQERGDRADRAEDVDAEHPGPVVVGQPVDAAELLHADVRAEQVAPAERARRPGARRRESTRVADVDRRPAARDAECSASAAAVCLRPARSSMSSAATAMPGGGRTRGPSGAEAGAGARRPRRGRPGRYPSRQLPVDAAVRRQRRVSFIVVMRHSPSTFS